MNPLAFLWLYLGANPGSPSVNVQQSYKVIQHMVKAATRDTVGTASWIKLGNKTGFSLRLNLIPVEISYFAENNKFIYNLFINEKLISADTIFSDKNLVKIIDAEFAKMSISKGLEIEYHGNLANDYAIVEDGKEIAVKTRYDRREKRLTIFPKKKDFLIRSQKLCGLELHPGISTDLFIIPRNGIAIFNKGSVELNYKSYEKL